MISHILAVGWRQLLLLVALLAFAGLIAHNLFYWQVTQHARLTQVAAAIYDSQTNIPALHGFIYDANSRLLVTDAPAFLVAADPRSIARPRYDAAKLARVLHHDPGPILAKLETPPPWRYMVIQPQVDALTAALREYFDFLLRTIAEQVGPGVAAELNAVTSLARKSCMYPAISRLAWARPVSPSAVGSTLAMCVRPSRRNPSVSSR